MLGFTLVAIGVKIREPHILAIRSAEQADWQSLRIGGFCKHITWPTIELERFTLYHGKGGVTITDSKSIVKVL
jgi:hypothetical protein